MVGVWHRGAEDAPGSLKSFGRQLREEYGSAYAGLDDKMLGLLEQLFDIPWGDEEPAPGIGKQH